MSINRERFCKRVVLPCAAVGSLVLGARLSTADRFTYDEGCATSTVNAGGSYTAAAYEGATHLGLAVDDDATLGAALNSAAGAAAHEASQHGDGIIEPGDQIQTCATYQPFNMLGQWTVRVTTVK